MVKNITAWKSTVLGALIITGVAVGLGTKTLSNEALIALVPAIMLILSNIFKEGKTDETGNS